LVQTEHNGWIYPTVMSRTSDGNFLVAGGSSDGQFGAWVSKVNAQWQTLWTTKITIPVKFDLLTRPEFLGIAAMPDGSAFLCGTMPRPKELEERLSTASLIHLDARGHAISKQLIISPNNKEKDLNLTSKFVNCTPWGDGFVVMGDVHQAVGTVIPQNGKREIKQYYWIIKYDATGKTQWEKFIPYKLGIMHAFPFQNSVLDKLNKPDKSIIMSSVPMQKDIINKLNDLGIVPAFAPQNTILIEAGNNLLFSATDTSMTDVVELSSTGDVVARTDFPGYFRLVHPFAGSHDIQLLSGSDLTLVTLDQNLHEKSRVQGDNSKNFFSATTAFEMPDSTIVVPGMTIPDYRPVIMHAAQDMQAIQYTDLKETEAKDLEQITTILPIDNNYNNFMIAKSTFKNIMDFLNGKFPADVVDVSYEMSIEIVNLK